MATLLVVENSEGSRRCDSHCHDAHESGCDCVCGGRYHGCGGDTAVAQIQQDVIDGRFGDELAEIAQYLTAEATQTHLF